MRRHVILGHQTASPQKRQSPRSGGAWKWAFALAATGTAIAGPYPPAAGRVGSDAIAADDGGIVGWAVEAVSLQRGPEEIDDPLSPQASYGSETSALGPSDVLGNVDQPEPGTTAPKPAVSLGDGGSITLRFNPPIRHGAGPDFAVFENGIAFNGGSRFFMELAFVEASSDGVQFVRFPAFSETPVTSQIGSFAAIDPTNVRNLAGKYMAGYGTPFDLAELADAPGLDLQSVTHLRIIDVVGSLDPRYARHDSLGRVVNDPWPTFLTTSGFDLDAVAVLHQAANGYPAWRTGFAWATSQSDPAADPDGDGVPNLLEYAFQLPPLQPVPPPPLSVVLSDEGWSASLPSWRAEAPDLTRVVEVSSDLLSWTTVPTVPTANSVPLGPANGHPVFCRFRFQLLPIP
ncbi:MAG: hypothetical protein ACKV19_06005 [Verrucomicrobiales bacterium]